MKKLQYKKYSFLLCRQEFNYNKSEAKYLKVFEVFLFNYHNYNSLDKSFLKVNSLSIYYNIEDNYKQIQGK